MCLGAYDEALSLPAIHVQKLPKSVWHIHSITDTVSVCRFQDLWNESFHIPLYVWSIWNGFKIIGRQAEGRKWGKYIVTGGAFLSHFLYMWPHFHQLRSHFLWCWYLSHSGILLNCCTCTWAVLELHTFVTPNHYTCCHWWQPHIVIACFSFASCPICS
jgi:hypothetical protein